MTDFDKIVIKRRSLANKPNLYGEFRFDDAIFSKNTKVKKYRCAHVCHLLNVLHAICLYLYTIFWVLYLMLTFLYSTYTSNAI